MRGFSLTDNIAEVSRACPAVLRTDIDGDAAPPKNKKLFLNPAQKLIYNFGAREMYVCAGRGMGKTTIMSTRLDNCVNSIPRGTGVFMGASIKQLYCKTMPNLVKSLEQLRGVQEGIHFFRGQPDKRLGWDMPLAKPRIWENVLSFPNGCVVYLISTGVASAANGMNTCFLMSDETRYLNWQVYKESILPSLRGDVFPGGGHPGWSKVRNPMYLSQFFVSDAGVIKKQMEWEEEELTQTDDINDQICERLAQLKYAEDYDLQHHTNLASQLANSQKFKDELNYLRTKSKVFMRFNSIHNISILGEDYIAARKRDMPQLLFNVQILGRKGEKDRTTLFYPNFNSEIHLYSPNESHETDAIYNRFQSRHHSIIDIGGMTKKIDYDAPDLDELSTMGDNCTLDVDIDPSKPLFIAHDFNNNVNTIVTVQEDMMEGIQTAKFLKSMFVVNPRMLEDLMEDWCRYYAPHRVTCPTVYLYYDSTAKQGGTYASRDAEQYRFYRIIERILKQHRWDVRLIALGTPMHHDIKFEFVNNCFAGKERYFPRINRINNDYLIASLENARTTTKFGAIHKDKGTEKKRTGEGLSDGDELGTNNLSDMSDAFDVMMRGLCHFGTRSSGAWGRSGTLGGVR